VDVQGRFVEYWWDRGSLSSFGINNVFSPIGNATAVVPTPTFWPGN
jgi:hypothetical protein